MSMQKANASATSAALLKATVCPYPSTKPITVPRLVIEKVIDSALKEIDDAYRSRQPWNIPDVPEERRIAAASAAKVYARKAFYSHRVDFTDERSMVNVIWHLTFASYFENLNRSGMQRHWYVGAADSVLFSRELNTQNIKWANALIKKAEESYAIMKSTYGGNGDIHFELKEDARLIRGLSSLSTSDIEQVNNYIDSHISRFSTPKIDDHALKVILDRELKGLLLVLQGDQGRFDRAATYLFVAAQELEKAGAKDWAKELIEKVKSVQNLYMDWRKVRINDPYAQDRRYILSNDNAAGSKIAELEEKIDRKDPSEAIIRGRDALSRLHKGLLRRN